MEWLRLKLKRIAVVDNEEFWKYGMISWNGYKRSSFVLKIKNFIKTFINPQNCHWAA